MKLHPPFLISARLLPALKIGDGWLSFDQKTNVFYLDTPKFDYVINGFKPGCWHCVQDCFKDMLCFFKHAIEEHRYSGRAEDSQFSPRVTEWLVANEYDICDMDCTLDGVDLIT